MTTYKCTIYPLHVLEMSFCVNVLHILLVQGITYLSKIDYGVCTSRDELDGFLELFISLRDSPVAFVDSALIIHT